MTYASLNVCDEFTEICEVGRRECLRGRVNMGKLRSPAAFVTPQFCTGPCLPLPSLRAALVA